MISSDYYPERQVVEAGAERLAPPVKPFQRDRVLPRLKNSVKELRTTVLFTLSEGECYKP